MRSKVRGRRWLAGGAYIEVASLAGAALLAASLFVAPAALSAQGRGPAADSTRGVRWFPRSSPFPSLLADPREVGLRGAFLAANRPDLGDYAGTNLEADVAVGHRFGVVRFQEATSRRPSVQLGFEVGVFQRFFMETVSRDLIDVTYRVGAPLSLAWRGWEGRLELLHESAHVGDDYLSRFGFPFGSFNQVSREGIELLVARRITPDVRVYAGGDANFHANPSVERTDLRWGAEWDPAPRRGAGDGRHLAAWPYAGADFLLTQTSKRVAGNGVAGVGLRVEGVTIRLEARGHYGPSSMGYFRNSRETYAGLGLRVVP
jgi:hypothetical protein